MKLMGRAIGPTTAMPAIVKKAMEILTNNPYPEYITRDYLYTFSEDGVVMYVIYDIAPGHEAEGLENILSRMAELGSAAEGIGGTLEPVFTMEQVFTWWGGKEA
jgi:hypothetical protein